MSEAIIEQYLFDKVKAAGGQCYKFSASITNGVPDRIVILNKTVFVELKAPGEKPRKLQEVRHQEIRNSGGEVYVIDSKQQVNDLVDKLKPKRRRTRKPTAPIGPTITTIQPKGNK